MLMGIELLELSHRQVVGKLEDLYPGHPVTASSCHLKVILGGARVQKKGSMIQLPRGQSIYIVEP